MSACARVLSKSVFAVKAELGPPQFRASMSARGLLSFDAPPFVFHTPMLPRIFRTRFPFFAAFSFSLVAMPGLGFVRAAEVRILAAAEVDALFTHEADTFVGVHAEAPGSAGLHELLVAREFTLGEALGVVSQSSLEVLISREAVTQAIEAQRQTRSGLLPRVTLDAAQRRSQVATLGGAPQPSPSNRFDGALNARLDLVNPVNLARYSAARAAVTVAQLGEAGTRQAILAAVAETYFAHLRNLERTRVLEDNIARAQRLLELATHQLNAGVATQIDVTRAEALVVVAEQALIQQGTVVHSSELALKRLLAFDNMHAPLALAPFELPRALPSRRRDEGEVFAHRAELRAARALLEQNLIEIRAARSNRLPSLALVGNYGYASAVAFNGDERKAWTTSAAVSVPIFDGAQTRAMTRQARSRHRAQTLRVRSLENQVSAEHQLAMQDAASRLAQIGVAETQLALAREELDLAEKRFEQGVADNREIIEAQGRLATAEDNLVEAIFLYNVSRVELARAQGEVLEILSGGNDL
ncbi:hypothetical protein AXK12_08070 [Cephaloticoccus capnophilus]|uniref:Transporter n=1 Tax=Cephaloticoccus capnophilus TaxID=1548208 RepID=A0A139SHM3_9BACT|nr:TolC family protein [Cephaloticoccus capnophilus]KXU33984.1 hypothetical protein AXK12_08070 [Cephaloticoccus capnophilus]